MFKTVSSLSNLVHTEEMNKQRRKTSTHYQKNHNALKKIFQFSFFFSKTERGVQWIWSALHLREQQKKKKRIHNAPRSHSLADVARMN